MNKKQLKIMGISTLYNAKVNGEPRQVWKSNDQSIVDYDTPTLTYKMEDVTLLSEIKKEDE